MQSFPDPNEPLLPPGRPSSTGPLIGAIIVVAMLVFGAFYFWSAYLNKKSSTDQLPFIPGDDSAQPEATTTVL